MTLRQSGSVNVIRAIGSGQPSLLTRAAAEELAARIAAYWDLAGHPQVRCWVEQVFWRGDSLWAVRSNLVRGLPPERDN